MRVLILSHDLAVFPGGGGHDYLHTTRLARLAQKVGLVTMVHTRELDEKKQDLIDAGVDLYVWRNPILELPASAAGSPRRRPLQRAVDRLYNFACNWRWPPFDTLIQDLQFRNISGPLLEALSHEDWSALIVAQSNCARWLDHVPRPPLSVLMLHDIRALVCERQAAAAGSWLRRQALHWKARRYRRSEGMYCRRYDIVITVSPDDEAWVRKHYRPARLATVPISVDGSYFAPIDDAPSLAQRVVEAIQDPELRARIGTQGHALVATHDPEMLARRYSDAIGAALREKFRQEEPFRAVIDLRWMRPGVAGGIENLSRSFMNRLLELDRVNRYTVLVPTEVRYDFDGRAAPNVTFEAADGPRAYARKAALIAARFLHGRLGVHVLAYTRGRHAAEGPRPRGGSRAVHPGLHPSRPGTLQERTDRPRHPT